MGTNGSFTQQFYIRPVAPAQIKNSFTSIGEVDAGIAASSLTLKLTVNNSALRYFVLSDAHRQIIFFGDYTLHHISSFDELAERIEKIVQKDEVLQLHFGKLLFGSDEKYSVVPEQFSFMVNRTSKFSQKCGGTEIVFENQEQITSLLSKAFPSAELLHLNSTYFHALSSYLIETTDKLFVNVSTTHLDVIRFGADKNLQLMNRYQYHAAADFIYFVLLACEELRIDREKTELVLLGEVDIQSKVYDLCYRYFRNISFVQKPDEINFSKAFDMFPKHLHYNLYNL